MPKLSNPKYETYAHNLAQGMKQIDAYVGAGFAASPASASQLAKAPEIQNRVQELIAERARLHAEALTEDGEDFAEPITKQWILRQARRNLTKAQASGNINSANKALELIMDLVGLAPQKNAPPPADDKPKTNLPDNSKIDQALNRLADLSPETPETNQESDE